jgi:hypothetical protein
MKRQKTTNYNKGKIYKIQPNIECLENEIYIGSTTKDYLSQRLVQHKSAYKRWVDTKAGGNVRVYSLFEKYGIDNCSIYLLENYPCNSKDELTAREGHYIQTTKCVNKFIPNLPVEVRKANKKARAKITQKLYNEKHAETMKARRKILYAENKHKNINNQICVCGCEIKTNLGMYKHLKSQKHKKYLEGLKEE